MPIPIFPELETNNKLVDPELTVNDPVPVETEADIDPVAICDKFNPTIEEAEMLVNPEPFPKNDPENEPDAIVTEPVTVRPGAP